MFVDEIHRFNKAQQDAFLPFVEKGSIILIGATTENPSFEVNGALLSRCQVFVLQALSTEELTELLERALKDPRGFGAMTDTHGAETCCGLIAVFSQTAMPERRCPVLEMAVLNGETQRRTASAQLRKKTPGAVHVQENRCCTIKRVRSTTI